jgi:hypothetical protein
LNEIIVFTKLFKNKSLPDLVAIGQSCRLDGYDLCLRPGYPINPDNVLETLVPAVETLSNAGLAVPMVTGSLDLMDPDKPKVEPILKAVSNGCRST